MKSKVIKILIGLIILSIVLYSYPIVKLAITDTRITKSLFVDEYYVKVSSEEFDFNVFRVYMESKGWKEIENKRMGGLNVFEKNGETKEIINTQIKTIFIDGRLNF